MQITKKQLKQIISEEAEKLTEETAHYQNLVENYSAGYDADEENISKEALIDLLEVIEEQTISRHAFETFLESLNKDSIKTLLEEVTKEEE